MAHAQLGEHGRKEEKGPIHLWLDRHTARVSLLDVRLRGQPLLVFDETETAILGTYPIMRRGTTTRSLLSCSRRALLIVTGRG